MSAEFMPLQFRTMVGQKITIYYGWKKHSLMTLRQYLCNLDDEDLNFEDSETDSSDGDDSKDEDDDTED